MDSGFHTFQFRMREHDLAGIRVLLPRDHSHGVILSLKPAKQWTRVQYIRNQN